MGEQADISNAKFTDCDFTVGRSSSIEIELTDGTVLNYRVAILRVQKSDQLDQDGNPVYAVASLANITVTPSKAGKNDQPDV